MKKLAVIALMLPTMAIAQEQAEFKPHPYAGISLHSGAYADDSLDHIALGGFGIKLGYQLNKNIAVELRHIKGTSEGEFSAADERLYDIYNSEVKLESATSLLIKPQANLSFGSVYGLVGLSTVKIGVEFEDDFFIYEGDSEEDNKLSLGIGADINFNDRLSGNAEILSYFSDGEDGASYLGLNFGIDYRFK